MDIQSIPPLAKLMTVDIPAAEGQGASERPSAITDSAVNAVIEENSERIDSARSLMKEYFADGTDISSSELLSAFADDEQFDMSEAESLFSSLGGLDWTSDCAARRIYDMAVKIADGDSDMMNIMRSAVMSAFYQVESSFGGAGCLPAEAYAAMERLNTLFTA